jgi:hypothetical protein
LDSFSQKDHQHKQRKCLVIGGLFVRLMGMQLFINKL